jgi:hypothetical protein
MGLDVNGPIYASAFMTTNQIVEALSSVQSLGISARSFHVTGRNLNA